MTNPKEVEKVIEFSDTDEQHHAHHTQLHSDSDKSLFLGILAYLGLLIIISYLLAKNNSFVKYHIKQGAVLVCIEIILWIISGMLGILTSIVGILELGVFVLAIIGIVNVVQKKEKALPIVGKYSKYIKI